MTVPLRAGLARLDGAAGGARRSFPHQKRQGEAYCASRGYHLAEALVRIAGFLILGQWGSDEGGVMAGFLGFG